MFFVSSPGATGACGYTYAGKPSGRVLTYPPCTEVCTEPWPSPDGHYTLGGLTVTDTASGHAVARLSDDAAYGYVWGSDSRHLCGLLNGPDRSLVAMVASIGGRPEQVKLAPVFTRVRYSDLNLVMCDPRHERAVLQTSYQHVTAIAVVSLGDGAIVAEHDFPDTGPGFPEHSTPVVTGVAVSPDGRYLAVLHAIQGAPGSPGPPSSPTGASPPSRPRVVAASPTGGLPPPIPAYLDLFDIEHPGPPIARLAGALDAAFSGDGTLLAERVPQANGSEASQVVRWSDQQVIWHGSETLSGEASAPGVPDIALQIYQPGQPSNQIVLIRPDEQPIPVAAGQLTVP
ncbi:hypothetical protein [Trebonia kvetii]|uniref:hypothetical protein n=1 Tax=Trebonia kvetii TaxID=2480626 RepID=UPI001C9E93F2|nr:hypothetical protein [Trebonia kvetii]